MAPSHPAGPNQLKLFDQWLETTAWLMKLTWRWPKVLRQSLTKRVELTAVQLLEDITSAAYGYERDARLLAANDALNRLRVLLRLAHTLEVISHKQYAEASRRVSESGRLLGAWMQRQGLQKASAPRPVEGE